MSRVPRPRKENLLIEHQRIWDSIDRTRGGVWGPYAVLMHVPSLAERVAGVGEYLRFQGKLLPAEREIAILTAAQMSRSDFEWSKHEPIARAAGVSDLALNSLRAGAEPAELSLRQRLIVQIVRELFETNHLSDTSFQIGHDNFGTEELIEIVTIAGFYRMLAFVMQAFDVRLDDQA